MRIITKRTLREFWEEYPNAESPLKRWYDYVEDADWRTPADVRASFNSADFVSDRVVFNISGNNFRLVVKIEYRYGLVYIRFIGTHAEYDRTNVGTV